ncbi:MAG TPA: DUF456 family protein [Anaerolineales bacterium]|nr:DUF456 family protein [Anaerolineales bacterium]
MKVVATVFAFLLMLAGLVGALLPVVPDTPLVLAGAVLLALADGFTPADLKLLAVLLLIALVAEGLGYLAGALGARVGGASWKGVTGALLGGLMGLLLLGLWGLLVGPMVGAMLGELWAGKEGQEAAKAGLGSLLGVLGGVGIKFAAGVTMVGLVVVSVLAK